MDASRWRLLPATAGPAVAGDAPTAIERASFIGATIMQAA